MWEKAMVCPIAAIAISTHITKFYEVLHKPYAMQTSPAEKLSIRSYLEETPLSTRIIKYYVCTHKASLPVGLNIS